jgi:hypothetical protein
MADLDHHVKRLLELYDGKAKDFQRYFILLIALSLFVLIFIMVPYVSTENDKYNVLREINTMQQLITNGNDTIIKYQSGIGGVNFLHNKLSNGTAVLRNYIIQIENFSKQPSPPELSTEQTGALIQAEITLFPNCNDNETRTPDWVECNVNEKILSMIDEYNQILDNNITSPLNTLQDESKKTIGLQNLTQDVKDLQIKFNNTLSKNPKFWRTVQGKAGLFAELDNKVQGFWNFYDSRIKSELTPLKTSLARLEIVLNNSENSLEKLIQEQENIKKRIDEFESPIGKLTAGFNDVITVFPFALGGGFLVCASILVETIRIRSDYFKFHPKHDNGHNLREDEVARTAPLWLDPKDEEQNKSIRIFVLLLPLFMYLVSIGLIFYTWNLPGTSFGVSPYFRSIMVVAYVFFVGVFAIALTCIEAEYSKVRN